MAPNAWIVRHGETAWSRSGQHTSRTDLELTPEGEAQARQLRPLLDDVHFDRVLCSPLARTRRTAELAGLTPYETTGDLREWDYGDLEGRTTADIQVEIPGWSIWDGPWPGGESARDVAARADRLLARIREDRELDGATNLALVGHGHFSRVLAARWVGEDPAVGRWLYLGTGTVSELGWDHGAAVIRSWNLRALA